MWTESRLDAKSKRLFCCAEVSGDRLSSVGGRNASPASASKHGYLASTRYGSRCS